MKISKTVKKTEIKLTVSMQPGTVSPAQKQAWRRFWQKLCQDRTEAKIADIGKGAADD